jgi:hypothetical protein
MEMAVFMVRTYFILLVIRRAILLVGRLVQAACRSRIEHSFNYPKLRSASALPDNARNHSRLSTRHGTGK